MPDSPDAAGSTLVIEPVGSISARTVTEFAKGLHDRIAAGARHVVIDFSNVELIAGDGIRVLVMVAEELRAAGGLLILCALGEPVRRVFDVSGLSGAFEIVGSRTEALERLAAGAGGAESTPAGTKLSRLAHRLLDDGSAATEPLPGSGHVPSELGRRVRDLLSGD